MVPPVPSGSSRSLLMRFSQQEHGDEVPVLSWCAVRWVCPSCPLIGGRVLPAPWLEGVSFLSPDWWACPSCPGIFQTKRSLKMTDYDILFVYNHLMEKRKFLLHVFMQSVMISFSSGSQPGPETAQGPPVGITGVSTFVTKRFMILAPNQISLELWNMFLPEHAPDISYRVYKVQIAWRSFK